MVLCFCCVEMTRLVIASRFSNAAMFEGRPLRTRPGKRLCLVRDDCLGLDPGATLVGSAVTAWCEPADDGPVRHAIAVARPGDMIVVAAGGRRSQQTAKQATPNLLSPICSPRVYKNLCTITENQTNDLSELSAKRHLVPYL